MIPVNRSYTKVKMSERLHPSDFLTDYEISQAGAQLQTAAISFERYYVESAPESTAESSLGMLTFSRAQVALPENRELEVRFIDQKVARMTLYSGWPEGFTAYFKDGVFQELDKIDATKSDQVSRKETVELLGVVNTVRASI